ncbi:MAG TPA: Ppx/GppA phosphatase family protein [Anaerolineales bacterium]|nr:Ppx/GppA phosphatase family protein [Anaerolineales bacterium]
MCAKLAAMLPPAVKRSIGLIDLGSNSVRLMIVRYTPGVAFKITHEFSRRVRLSEGMSADPQLRLQPAAMERTIRTLATFRAFCEADGVKRIIPVATAAVRDAGNRAEFLARAKAATGLKFRVLSGEEEAYFGFLGVVNTLGLRAGLVMDIGGGSAEVSRIGGGRFKRGITRPLGAVRLTEMYLTSDPVQSEELRRLSDHVAAAFRELDWMRLRPGEQFAGVGGAVRALARIDREMRGYPLDLVNGYELELSRLDGLIARLGALPIAERLRQVPGLPQDRADIILAGAVVVAEALRRVKASRLIVCGHGLREGLFFREFLRPAEPPLIPDLREFSVLNLARLCGYEKRHADQVAYLALSLFDQLFKLHRYGATERGWLWAAAQLHHIGAAAHYYDPYKHSSYLILSNGLHGYVHREIALLALLCLYLRGEKPALEAAASAVEAGTLEQVERLGTLLRLAEALDVSQTQAVREVRVQVSGKRVTLHLDRHARLELSWELEAARRNAGVFEEVFGRRLEIIWK